MPDVHTSDVRSKNMRAIRSKNTRPEVRFRKALHAEGFRYRLHARGIPGNPDLVLPRYRAAIFVHGCFWHGHGCPNFFWPKTRKEFWHTKIEANRARDVAVKKAILDAGWRHLTVWECSIPKGKKPGLGSLANDAAKWLRGRKATGEL